MYLDNKQGLRQYVQHRSFYMTPEATSRRPQEGTGRLKVFKAVKEEGMLPWDTGSIATKTGLPRRTVSVALANLRRDGYLEKPTKEETKRSRRLAAATVLLPIMPYREMGMSIREIRYSLLIKEGNDISRQQIDAALTVGTKSGNLRRLSATEKNDIRKDANILSEEQVLRRVAEWLMVRDWLIENGRPLPTSRFEWKSVIESIGHINNKKVFKIDEIELTLSLRGIPQAVALGVSEEIARIQHEDKDGILFGKDNKDILFVAKLLEEGIIDNDISSFYVLKDLFRGKETELTNLSVDVQLRLEAFVKVVMQELKGSTGLRERFIKIGEGINRQWFYDRSSDAVKQQIFIRQKLGGLGLIKT